MKILKTIGAGIGVVASLFYVGCGSIPPAEAGVPVIAQIVPQSITTGTSDATVEVVGSNFTNQTVVLWNGGEVATTVVNNTTLAGTVAASNLTVPGTAMLQLQNNITGQRSAPMPIKITSPVAATPLTMTTTSLPSAAVGAPYSVTLAATGGAPSYTWRLTSGKMPSGLALSSSTGILSGTPTVAGSYSLGITVSDRSNPTQEKLAALTLVVAAANSLNIATTSLPSTTVGASYSQTLLASGGTPSYRWSIASGSLPTGLTLASTGTISGTPTVSGTFSLNAAVADQSTPVQTRTIALTITVAVATTPLKISTSALASGAIGSAYSQSLSASGGTPSYTWSLVSGSLPTGLTLTSTGAISGTPTASGTASFTTTVRDSGNPVQAQSVTLSITIAATPLKITASTLAQATDGRSYMQSLQATGGTPGYTWTITSGSLPAGLTLASTGAISGIPTASGSSTFTASVSDSSNPVQTVAAALTISVAPAPITITASALATATAGSAYSQTLHATGGTAPYTWSIKSGHVPAGLSLSSSAGVISGKPTASGTANFTAMVTDSSNPAQTASLAMTIVVAASQVAPVTPPVQPAKLTITASSLTGGTIGAAYSQTLSASGGTAPYSWAISSGQLPAGLALSASTGAITGTASASDASGGYSFAVTVTDSSSPAQTASASTSITLSATPLSITSSALAAGTDGIAYSSTLRAAGGTPAYTWSISGSLPAGLTLAASTGTISGTPTGNGTSSFTATVTDNGIPAQVQSVATSITVATQQAAGSGTTWYVRPDGGTRYSSNAPTGQCNGKADSSYPGTGVNQNCAFNDFRYLWSDNSGTGGAGTWIISGGDTVYIFGCAALPSQVNPANPDCRIGYDTGLNGNSPNSWCPDVGPYTCYNPPIPAGTSAQHTRILGGCVLTSTCNSGNTTIRANLTQLFGGFGLTWTFNVGSTQYVDIEGIELTTHNGACSHSDGSPAYPTGCSTNVPLSDYADNGFLTNNTTANITFQDVYVDGFDSSGFFGPIGGAVVMTRVNSSFNAQAGWNFDDGSDTPDAAGSSITANYVTMEGNGCKQQYPIANAAWPALACWDTSSGGFGDSWSGQDTELDAFSCNHCVQMYNTKDGFIGPHTQIKALSITNSVSIGNMGAQWKWGQAPNGTVLFQNNLTVLNPYRQQTALPGAAQNFNISTGLPGSYLSAFGRGDEGFANLQRSGSVNNYYGNTIIAAQAVGVSISCGYYSTGNVFNQETNCASVPNLFKDNLFLGYVDPNAGAAPATYSPDAYSVIVGSYNDEFGMKSGSGDTCGSSGNICVDPLLVSEPAQSWPGSEASLDVFNPFVSGNSFYPTSGSPLIGAGTAISGLTADYYGIVQTSPSMGAVEP